MVETSCNKIESIELISFESSENRFRKWNRVSGKSGTNLSKLQTYVGGHISVDDIVLMVETSCNKIESIELISFESSKASMAAPHSRQSHQNFIT